MLLLYPKRFSDRFLLQWADKAAFLISLFTCVCVGSLWLSYLIDAARSKQIPEKTLPPSFPGEVIGQGPLALRPVHKARWIAEIAEQLTLLAYNSRPDQERDETEMILELKEGKQQVILTSGAPIRLQEKEGKIALAKEGGGSLWLRPILLDESCALLEVGRESSDGKIETGQFITSFQGIKKKGGALLQESLSCLIHATALPPDLVIERYGGKEFSSLTRRFVLDIPGKRGEYALFVTNGEFLLYEEGEWKIVSEGELKQGAPIGKIVSASEHGVDLLIWDEQGFAPVTVQIGIKKEKKTPFPPESLPSLARFRTPSQVTCLFNKRRIILRQGDWLIKGGSGWRHVRSSEEFQLLIERKIRGDLFICEAIDRDDKGKGVMRGVLFDETHTFMQTIQIPVTNDKPIQKTSRKRRGSAKGLL